MLLVKPNKRRMRYMRDSVDADDARGGDIVLRRPWPRAVFIAALAGAVVLGLILGALFWH